jgi:hypothetical protein
MANNIKIVGDILTTTLVSRYTDGDKNLLSPKEQQDNFGGSEDYIEYYIYDISGNLLNTEYNYLSYKLPPTIGLTPGTSTPPNTTGNIQTTDVGVDSTLSTPTSSLYPIIEIDPITDLQNYGYSSGEFKVRYNFFQNKISNVTDADLFIKEISQDRTELRLASLTLPNEEIETLSISLIDEMNNSTEYYVDYLLNFGDNVQVVAVNIALNRVPEGYEILFKLYQPLPLDITDKIQLWVVDEKVDPYEFEINLDKLVIPAPPPQLKGPNFDIEISNINTGTTGTIGTPYTNYATLIARLETLQNSSYQQILGLLASQSADINIDYSEYDNFSFFGSVEQRLVNFYDKAKQIENYKNQINVYTPLTSSFPNLITEINQYQSSINNIITEFDGYENYLYFESGSYSWPKSGSLKPFELLSTGSAATINWYDNALLSASIYDRNNVNNLKYSIPSYLVDDTNNQPFITFLSMVGHYFDNIWIYLKSITDINVANNNLEAGVSKDLVYYQLQSLGLKLYNSQAGESVDQFLIGANTGSSTWDNNTTITGSYLNNVPRKDLVSELYKRIYHNLPLLLKQKGTVEGLDNLMTIFGIPSREYYTLTSGSIQTTYYTPTGSSVTASILNVKEYGGGLKSNLISGYNNDKVRIINNAVTESVLSSILSLQTYPTSSNEFRENDMHYIDISFSPENQMDTYISGAIASNNPTWSLDDYIGDPGYLYSSSYSDLDAQRKLYFQTGVPGYAPFTASLLDYNGFIRLVEYFDNALFKMLVDFIPERASLSTGVTINSPVLERNKVAYASPINSTTQSVPTAEYSASTISSTYGTFYNALSSSNNTMGWFDGELSGSTIDIYQYFTEANYNPYLSINPKQIITNTDNWYVLVNVNNVVAPWVVIVPTSNNGLILSASFALAIANQTPLKVTSISGDSIGDNNGSTVIPTGYHTDFPGSTSNIFYISFRNITQDATISNGAIVSFTDYSFLNDFAHSDFNVLLNNVSSSVQSNIRQNIEYIWGTTGSILKPAELQDSYLTLSSYNVSRYEGSKTTSQRYNIHTIGDNSFGETAAIDHTVRKIGIFTQIASSSFLPKRNNVSLKYLVDEFGNLTELNQQNKNWCDIQRTLIMGDTASVSLFDNKKYSNQKSTDGKKLIFDSGYTYAPVLYGSGSDTRLYFENINTLSSNFAQANNAGISEVISGSSNPGHPVVGGYVQNLFNNRIADDGYLYSGIGSAFPSYSISENGGWNVSASFNISVNIPNPGSASFNLQIITGSTVLAGEEQIFEFSSTTPSTPTGVTGYLTTKLQKIFGISAGKNVRPITIAGITYPANSTLFYYYSGLYGTNTSCTLSDLLMPGYSLESSIDLNTDLSCPGIKSTKSPVYDIPNFNIPSAGQTITKSFNVGLSGFLFTSGSIIQLTLSQSLLSTNNYTASISLGNLSISSVSTGDSGYVFVPRNNAGYFNDAMNFDFANPCYTENELVFENALANFYSPDYQFIPSYQYLSGSNFYSNSLYNTYGDIEYPFQLKPMDIFAAYDVSGSYFESRITQVYRDTACGGFLRVRLANSIPQILRYQLSAPNDLGFAISKNYKFLFLTRVDDETNAHLTFPKRPGSTSYGFLIPENLSPDVLVNIDTITKQVKQKLLADQQGTT